jgi:hypothetical protein
MELQLNAISVRHGQIDDGPYWCKINTLSDEITDTDSFTGQATVEYSVSAESAKMIAKEAAKILPAPIFATCQIMQKSGKPDIRITSIKASAQ